MSCGLAGVNVRAPSAAAGANVAPVGTGASAQVLPCPDGPVDIDGAIGMLMKLSAAIHDAQARSQTEHAKTVGMARKAASERRSELLERAAEAARKATEERSEGGLFDVITDNLGPIGLVGLVVGGAFLVAADLAAHATGLEDDKLDVADAGALAAMFTGPAGVALYAEELCAKRFGPEELQKALDQGPSIRDDEVRKANKIALAVTQAQLALAATVASGGTAAPAVVAMVGIGVSTAAQILQETGTLREVFGDGAAYVALGATAIGAGLGLGGGVYSVASGLSSAPRAMQDTGKVLSAIQNARAITQAGHDIAQGVRNLGAADDRRQADGLQVDAQRHKRIVEFLDRMIDAVLDDLEGLQESARKSSEICQAMSQTHHQTMLLAGNLRV